MAGSRSGDRGRSEGDLRSGTSELSSAENPARRSFDAFLSEYTISDYERRELVHFLAAYRYRRTLELLL